MPAQIRAREGVPAPRGLTLQGRGWEQEGVLRCLLNVPDPAVAEDSARHGRVLTAGLGGMGGAQPLAITNLGGRVLVVEVDPARAERRRDAGWVDMLTTRERGLLVFDAAAI